MKSKRGKAMWLQLVSYSTAALCAAVISCISCSSTMTTGHFVLNGTVSPVNETEQSQKIERLESGSDVPAGYELIISGEFKTGIITMQCGETFMIDEAMKLCRSIGADAFRLFEIHEPDMITNTCYRAKILILKKKT
jgi:hypothetical protein